jgi:hypothetical protein
MHAIYHRVCDHALTVGPDRKSLTALLREFQARSGYNLRLRIASTEDITSAAQGITCNACVKLKDPV